MLAFVILVVGFVLLVWGADRFVDGASSLAHKLGIPTLIIGLTVVAFGTSAPELAVSITAGLNHSNEIVIGNVLGSNLFNLLMVAGASSLICPLVIDKALLHRDWVATLLATLALLGFMVWGNDVSRLDGILLLVGFAVILTLQIRSAMKSHQEHEHDLGLQLIEKNHLIAAHILFGLAAIVLGGQLAVQGATEIARMFHLSETLIGLTIVAIGTSLPELVTSIVATKQGQNGIAIGNVVGSNLFNILLILGISSTFNPIPIAQTAIWDTLLLLVVSVVLFFFAKKGKFQRPLGIAMLMSYGAYTAWIIAR